MFYIYMHTSCFIVVLQFDLGVFQWFPQKMPPVDLSWLPKVWTIALSPNGSVSAAPGGLDGQPWWSGRIKVTIAKRDLGRPLD